MMTRKPASKAKVTDRRRDGPARRMPFQLHRASFKGNGRQPEFALADWEPLRDAVYRGRGT